MARENQGLQIALIAFVMLTVIFGVMTFLFYKQYDEQRIQAETAKKEKGDADTARAETEKANKELKRLIGVAETEDMAAVSNTANDDFNRHGGPSFKDEKNYRKLLAYLDVVLHDKDRELADVKKTNDDLSKQLKARASIAQPQIDTAMADAQARTNDLKAERDKFNQDRANLNTEKDDLAAKLDKAKKDMQALITKGQEQIALRNAQIKRLQEMVLDKDAQVTKLTKPQMEVPDGKVTWVSQRDGVVYIDLGRADALATLTSFSVYGADTSNVASAEKKASIEVTEVIGDHLAKARIVEDKVSDPVVPGDLIHTPIWSPGERKHFAIVGVIDLDNDDKSDLRELLGLIRLNGGVVDAYQEENGEVTGKITQGTQYLVEGKEPRVSAIARDPNSEKTWVDNFTALKNDAKKYLVKEKKLDDLLMEMGYKGAGLVQRYGAGVPASQFKVTPTEGGQRVSTGSVSPLFKPRQPPRSSAAGAY